MLAFRVGEALAKFICFILPKRFSDRIRENAGEMHVYVLRTKSIKTKKKMMTMIEAVFATILFDLALFGTSNPIINGIISTFTNFQNSWDKRFSSKSAAKTQVEEFCDMLAIQQEPWIWEKSIEEYVCLNDFFSRTYKGSNFPPMGASQVISPASCSIRSYNNDEDLKSLLIKGCDYQIEDIGLPVKDIEAYRRNHVFIGYLSPTDYHRVHSPIRGKCVHCKMEGNKKSSSVKFFEGKFNIMNENRRLVIVLEVDESTRVAVVIIGGIGVDSIVFNENIIGQQIDKGQELSMFRAGGSAFAMFSTQPLHLTQEFKNAIKICDQVEVQVGESLCDF